jgi:diguanylate cyclase (GGDEF)-like protein/PAS domain S-box-containing protein
MDWYALSLVVAALVIGGMAVYLRRLNRQLADSAAKARQIESSLQTLSVAIEQSPVSVVITDADATIQYVNPQFTVETGYGVDEAMGKNPRILQSGLTDRAVFENMWQTLLQGEAWTGEFINRRRNGELFFEEAHIAPVQDDAGNTVQYVAVKLDITERKRAEERLAHLAHHDALTNLPNRPLFQDRMQQALALARRERQRLALLYLDLDGFKTVNDRFGHAVGDLLLQEAARRISGCVRASDTVGRIGGDEFVVLLSRIDTEGAALQVAEKVRAALGSPFTLAGRTVQLSCSIGIALYPDHGDDDLALAHHADLAMYRAKEGGRNAVRLFAAQNV